MNSPRTRRVLLQAAAAGILSRASAAGTSPIIDTHIHLYDPTRPQGVPWPSKTDPVLYKPTLPDRYAAMVRPLGITGTMVVEASSWVEDNQWVLDLARDHPIIVGLVGHLEAGTAEFATHLTRFAKNRVFRGIRLNGNAIATGLEKPAFLEDLQRLADAGLMLDGIGNANMIAALLKLSDRIPKLKIAIDHMPEEPVGWQASAGSRAGLRELGARAQVYAKVSGVLKRVNGKVADHAAAYRASLDEVWTIFGENRVMYGSNWPVSDHLAPYATVLQVVREYVTGKGLAASAKFFAGNAKDCYGWIERG